jgi:hypothetical protein
MPQDTVGVAKHDWFMIHDSSAHGSTASLGPSLCRQCSKLVHVTKFYDPQMNTFSRAESVKHVFQFVE